MFMISCASLTSKLTFSYFLFAATLMVLSNQYACLYRHDNFQNSISNAIKIVTYCSQSDVQAHRLLYIITTFRSVVEARVQQVAAISRFKPWQRDLTDVYISENLVKLVAGPQLNLGAQGPRSAPRSRIRRSVNPQTRSSLATVPVQQLELPKYSSPKERTALPDFTDARPGPASASEVVTTQASPAEGLTDENSPGQSTLPVAESLSSDQEFDFESFWNMDLGVDLVQNGYQSQSGEPMDVEPSLHRAPARPHAHLYTPYRGYDGAQDAHFAAHNP